MQNGSRSFEKRASDQYSLSRMLQVSVDDKVASLRRSSFRPVAASGVVMKTVLNQERAAINDNDLPSSKSFLHQEQIGLRDLGSLADSANRETVAHAFE
jgi:hypothetical protein